MSASDFQKEQAVQDVNPQSQVGRCQSCSAGNEAEHRHEWVVYSATFGDRTILVQCVRCGLHGAIDTASKDECSQVHSAMARPHRWDDESRVVCKGRRSGDQFYVVRSDSARLCDCFDTGLLPEGQGYERVPQEIFWPAHYLTDDDRTEIRLLADVVVACGICSDELFDYLDAFEEDNECQYSDFVWELIMRIHGVNQMGLHCSPSVVALLLRQCADVTGKEV